MRDVTELLAAWRSGDADAPEALVALVYDDLRAMAARRLAAASPTPLQATELAHEVLARMLDKPFKAVDRVHLFRTLALALRQVLTDVLRREHAEKRGGGVAILSLEAADDVAVAGPDAWFALESALAALEVLDARKCRVVEMSLLLGLPQEEIAQTLEISVPTVERDLRFARAWLRDRLSPSAS